MSNTHADSGLGRNAQIFVEIGCEEKRLGNTHDPSVEEQLVGSAIVLEKALEKVEVAVSTQGPVVIGGTAGERAAIHADLCTDSVPIWPRPEFVTVLECDSDWPAECVYLRLSDCVEKFDLRFVDRLV